MQMANMSNQDRLSENQAAEKKSKKEGAGTTLIVLSQSVSVYS